MADAKDDIVLSIRGMCKSFGRNRVLDHINLDVKRGTVMGLMGENGAGKSTMMKCLFGTYQKDEGKIYLNGTKTFITSSAGVKYLVIMAKNADDPTMFTEFFLDMSKPGVKLSPLTKLGLRMDSCCEVYMDNVELEEKDIFGKEGNGFMRGVSDFNFERWLVGACDYGTAICAFEDRKSVV